MKMWAICATEFQLKEVKMSQMMQAIEAGYWPDDPSHNRCTLVAALIMSHVISTTEYQLEEVKILQMLQALQAGYWPENLYHNKSISVACSS